MQARVPGKDGFKLKSLAWASSTSYGNLTANAISYTTSSSTAQQYPEAGRLFGVSLRGFVFEVDLFSLTVTHVRDSYGGAAWCLAVDPKLIAAAAAASVSSTNGARSATSSCILAVGCDDGAARLFTYADGGLEYEKTFPTTGSRVLSVCFHPVLWQLLLGCADGSIRCLDQVYIHL